MKQQHSASKSKRKISQDSAHRPQNKAISLSIHCVFTFRAPLQKSNFARRNAIARIIDNGGAPKHRAECAKIRLSHQKVRKRGLAGACRAPAKCPKCCDSSSVSLMRREKTPPYSRNTKRFSEKQLNRATRQETVIPVRHTEQRHRQLSDTLYVSLHVAPGTKTEFFAILIVFDILTFFDFWCAVAAAGAARLY